MGLSIPHVFTNEKKANADSWNENFAAIAAKLTDIGDDEIPDEAISESKVKFNSSTGHDHSGEGNGKAVTLDEDQVTFNNEGHDHSGGSEGKLVAKAGLADDGDEGTIKVRSGSVTVTNGTVDFPVAEQVDLSGFDTALIALDVYWVYESTQTNRYLGMTYRDADGKTFGYDIYDVSKDSFKIRNQLEDLLDAGEITFNWTAIGI